jgi:glycerol-3-phosphate dehydrogenase
MRRRHPQLPEEIVDGIARRHGSLAPKVLDDARTRDDLGEDFGAGLTAAEVDYCIRHEWARTADDILWRRSKCGLGMTPAQRERVAAYVASRVAGATAAVVAT